MGKGKKSSKRNSKRTPQPIGHTFQNPQKALIKKPQQDPIKILIWGASPYVITGFGTVMKHMLKGLFRAYPKKYDICQMGINYFGDHVEEAEITGGLQNGRYRQWPASANRTGQMMDMFGQARFIQLLNQTDYDFDMIFMFEDPFWIGGAIPRTQHIFIDQVKQALHRRGKTHIPVITYFPIDGIPNEEWLVNLAKYDILVTYLNFGARFVADRYPKLEGQVNVIPHGVDHSEYFPIPKDELRSFKRALLGEENVDKFVFLNCNRNQLRKFVPSNMMAFKAFKEKHPDSLLYLHMKEKDVGWDLVRAAKNLGLEVNKDIFFPQGFEVSRGVSIEDLNKIFNIADAVTSTALGGGFELAIIQAFASKTVTIMPDNTSHSELCAEDRGFLFNCGNKLSLQAILPGDNEVIRPLPDTDDLARAMIEAYENPEECRKREEAAYKWTVEKLKWSDMIRLWDVLFSKAKMLKNQRVAEIQEQIKLQQQVQQMAEETQQNVSAQGSEAVISFEDE